MASLNELIVRANQKGLLVSNLMQLTASKWRANVRTVDYKFSEFGEADSPELALEIALRNAPNVNASLIPANNRASGRVLLVKKRSV